MATQNQDRPELAFDGRGINGPDQFRERVATFNPSAPKEWLRRYGPMFAASPVLVRALEGLLQATELNLDEMEPETELAIDEANEALRLARTWPFSAPETVTNPKP